MRLSWVLLVIIILEGGIGDDAYHFAKRNDAHDDITINSSLVAR